VGIGTRTGERLLTKPEIRQVVEQTRTAGEGEPTIRALLEATDEAGNPDWVQQVQGVELARAELASLAGESGGKGSLLPGRRRFGAGKGAQAARALPWAPSSRSAARGEIERVERPSKSTAAC
jgi:hypothetical protein